MGSRLGWIGDCVLAWLVCIFICMYNVSVCISGFDPDQKIRGRNWFDLTKMEVEVSCIW